MEILNEVLERNNYLKARREFISTIKSYYWQSGESQPFTICSPEAITAFRTAIAREIALVNAGGRHGWITVSITHVENLTYKITKYVG